MTVNSEAVEQLETEDTQEGQYLTFPLGDSMCGIEIQNVIEVVIRIEQTQITPIPRMPPYNKGVINLRGKVIPVLDLRLRFSLPEREHDNRTCFVVVQLSGIMTGLIIDTVSEVISIPSSEIDPPPPLGEDITSQFIAGMGKTKEAVYILLDMDQILEMQELEEIQEAISS